MRGSEQRSRKDHAGTTRVLLWSVVAILVLLLIGAIYQTIATEIDQRRYPPPGELVEVGNHRLHIHCVGEGSPTVILESTSGGTSANWGWVRPEVAKTTRVCAYDRGGRGWSELGPQPRDAIQIAGELHALLRNADVPAPYVLVAHSAGGLFIREYAEQYPNEVGGWCCSTPRIQTPQPFPLRGKGWNSKESCTP